MAETFIPIPVDGVEEAAEQSSLTYRLDIDSGRIIGKIDGLEACNQAIRKAIITPRFKCLIYDNQYGSEIEAAASSLDVTQEYLQSAIEGYVRDSLSADTRIINIYEFEIRFIEDELIISFKVDTIFGETNFEEVMKNV